MEKILKARKEHICYICEQPIEKGEMYNLQEFRSAKYKETNPNDHFSWESEIQIGIEFNRFKRHVFEKHCDWPEECKKGNHKPFKYHDGDPESETCGQDFVYCEVCSADLKSII